MEDAGCTSFAVSGDWTSDGAPFSGQTKDTPVKRLSEFRVLRLDVSDAPSLLTLTYPGWLFGHGFAEGGCALFRNSLFAGLSSGELGYGAWGLIATHCSSVDEVCEIAAKYGINGVSAHCLLQDSQGGIAGLEIFKDGVRRLGTTDGLYVHSNHLLNASRSEVVEDASPEYLEDSHLRLDELSAKFAADKGDVNPRRIIEKLAASHERYPFGLCNHAREDYQTTAAVVAEPSKGTLTVSHGPPCQAEVTTHSI
jgi:hypothetical protein